MVTRFQKEISLILILKVIAIALIWATWFKDPPPPRVAEHLIYHSESISH